MVKKSARPVEELSSEEHEEEIKDRIRQKTEENIARYALAGGKAIERRLEELDREWDIDRCTGVNVGAVSLLGVFLGATRSRKWYLAPFLASFCLVQQATQGRSPLTGLFRRWGIRTREEIEHERFTLKVLRGDFEDLKPLEVKDQQSSIHDTFEAVRR
jgi:hypothetical protein